MTSPIKVQNKTTRVLLDPGSNDHLHFMKKGSSKVISIVKRIVPQLWGTSNGTVITDRVGDIEISFVEYWCKLPKKVLYKRTFGAPDQGQTLEVWESQTTESALRWRAPYHSTSYSWSCSWSYSWSYSWTHVLGLNTMASLILDHVVMDYLYLGTNTERKIYSWKCPGTRSW